MKNKIKKILKNDTVERVYKTFIQGFLGALAVSLTSINDYSDILIVKSFLVGAIASGLSAVMNLIINKLNS